MLQVEGILVVVLSKNDGTSKYYYQALGFNKEYVSEDLSLYQNGDCSLFLQQFYNHGLANNHVLQ